MEDIGREVVVRDDKGERFSEGACVVDRVLEVGRIERIVAVDEFVEAGSSGLVDMVG